MTPCRILLLMIYGILLPSVSLAQYGYCTATNGRRGECISTSKCKSNGGTSDPANLCPGDNTIQVKHLHIHTSHCIDIFRVITVLHVSYVHEQ